MTPTLNKFYDVRQPVIVSADGSKRGYDAVISQESGLISYASRCFTPAESNYAPIESELSAVLYGCTRFHDYICSQKVTIETDHKPLVGIMAKSYKFCPRIQSMRRKLLWYDMNATWKPGNKIVVPDCLSQAPVKQAVSMQELGVIVEADNIISQLPVPPEKLQEFRDNTANDADLQLHLQNTVTRGWPMERSKVPEAIRP